MERLNINGDFLELSISLQEASYNVFAVRVEDMPRMVNVQFPHCIIYLAASDSSNTVTVWLECIYYANNMCHCLLLDCHHILQPLILMKIT